MAILHAWRFCPRCAADARPRRMLLRASNVRRAASSATRTRRRAPARSSRTTQGRVLLGRRAVEPDLGLWDMLGGYLEEHEHPLDGLRRELLEETGLDDRARSLPRASSWAGYGDGAGRQRDAEPVLDGAHRRRRPGRGGRRRRAALVRARRAAAATTSSRSRLLPSIFEAWRAAMKRRLPLRRRQHAARQRPRRRRSAHPPRRRGRRGLRAPVLAALRGAPRRARLRRLPRRPAALPRRAPARPARPRRLALPRLLPVREPALPRLARRARPLRDDRHRRRS